MVEQAEVEQMQRDAHADAVEIFAFKRKIDRVRALCDKWDADPTTYDDGMANELRAALDNGSPPLEPNDAVTGYFEKGLKVPTPWRR